VLKIKFVVSAGTMGLAVIVLLVRNAVKKRVTVFALPVNIAITKVMPALARLVMTVKKKRAAALVMNKVI